VSEIMKSRSYFLALLALKTGPKHGYEIAAHIKAKSRGFFTVSFGNLYPILHKLEKNGLVEAVWEDKGEQKNKKIYTLTAQGLAELEIETQQFSAMIDAFAGLMET